jgi:hypothetical protein
MFNLTNNTFGTGNGEYYTVGYYTNSLSVKSNQYDCQNPLNKNNPLSTDALHMQRRYDNNQKTLNPMIKSLPFIIH